MATTVTRKAATPRWNDPSNPDEYETAHTQRTQPRQAATSITAHVVMMGTVTMAFAELDVLRNMISKVDAQNEIEQNVKDEFIRAVDSLR